MLMETGTGTPNNSNAMSVTADPSFGDPGAPGPTAAIMRLLNSLSPAIAGMVPDAALKPLATIGGIQVTPLLLVAVYAAYRVVR